MKFNLILLFLYVNIFISTQVLASEINANKKSSQTQAAKVWYAGRNGSWDDPKVWTINSGGIGGYGQSGIPNSTDDKIIIKPSATVIVPDNYVGNINHNEIEVIGTLDLGEYPNAKFNIIKGSGKIRMKADNFPQGEASEFSEVGRDEGTVVFYGNNYQINREHEFYNVQIELDNNNSLINLNNNLKINGKLEIIKGKFNFYSSSNITLDLLGDLLVKNNGSITTRNVNVRHQFNFLGHKFENNGDVSFTNIPVPMAYETEASNGIVDFNVIDKEKDQIIILKGNTKFYRIEIDKMVPEHKLKLESTKESYFKLYGPLYDIDSENITENPNALGLQTGTLELGSNINLNLGISNNNYSIPFNSCLWINGGELEKNNNVQSQNSLITYGEFKISSGIANITCFNGLTISGNGLIKVEGGTLNVSQISTLDKEGNNNAGGYNQSGGIVHINASSNYSNNFCSFNLSYEGNAFKMSGGELNIHGVTSKGGIFINSAPENIGVTGGGVNCYANTNKDFTIISSAPFYNVNFRAINSTGKIVLANSLIINDKTYIGKPLKVINDLHVGLDNNDYVEFSALHNNTLQDVYIGGSLRVRNGSKYICMEGGETNYDSLNRPICNTTYFNHTIGTHTNEYIDWGYRESSQYSQSHRLELGNIVIDRKHDCSLIIRGSISDSDNIMLDINGDLNIKRGVFNQANYKIRTLGDIYNNGRLGIDNNVAIEVNKYGDGKLFISGGTEAVFGSIVFRDNKNIELKSDIKIEHLQFYNAAVYLKNYRLTLDELTLSNNYSINKNSFHTVKSLFYTDGNSSDGSLRLKITQNGEYIYPIGFKSEDEGAFRPVKVTVSDFQNEGYIDIRFVNKKLNTVATTSVLDNHWNVAHEGFSNKPNVLYTFYGREKYNTGTAWGYVQNSYSCGYVLTEEPYTRHLFTEKKGIYVDPYYHWSSIYGDPYTTERSFNFSSSEHSLINADYTASNHESAFTGTPKVFYSVSTDTIAIWDEPSTWTRKEILNTSLDPHHPNQPKCGWNDYPGEKDIVEIGYNPETGRPHCVKLTGNEGCAKLIFKEKLNAEGKPIPRNEVTPYIFRPTLRIDRDCNLSGGIHEGNQLKTIITGVGTLYLRHADPDFTSLDMGEFARQDSSYVVYEFSNNAGTADHDENVTLLNNPEEFPNLMMCSPDWGVYDNTVHFDKYIKVNGNLEIVGNTNFEVIDSIRVEEDLLFSEINTTLYKSGGGAEFRFIGSNSYKVFVGGNLEVRNGGTKIIGNTTNHILEVQGNITQQAGSDIKVFDFNNSNSKVDLVLSGNESMVYNRLDNNPTAIPDFNRIIVNKGYNKNTTATINTNINVNGATNGDEKAVELQKGTLVLNNSAIDVNLSTGGSSFLIPKGAGLTLNAGKLSISNSDLLLDGRLWLRGGEFDMGTQNNDIEYSNSGKAELIVNGASSKLNVGGQVRRGLTQTTGVFKYTQTQGEVNIGTAGYGTESTRGMFEVVNEGSKFFHIGGKFTIHNQNTDNPQEVPALLLEPQYYNVRKNTTINIFGSQTNADQNEFGIQCSIPLSNISIGEGVPQSNTSQVILKAHNLNVNNINISDNSKLKSGGRDIFIKGDFTCNGEYEAEKNTVYFNGNTEQTIKGNKDINFFNLTKNKGVSRVNLNTNINVNGNFTLETGVFNTIVNNLYIKGNVINNSKINSDNGGSVTLDGTLNQKLLGIGSFDVLKLNNTSGFDQEIDGEITINKLLDIENGVLDIKNNLFKFGEFAVTESQNGFSAQRMIQTNIAIIDQGIVKYFNRGTIDFTYPIGANGVYTPVTIKGNTVKKGSIRVVANKKHHPTIIEDNDINDVLQFYWILKANNIKGFTGNISFKYSDELIGANGNEQDYITAKVIEYDRTKWFKNGGTIDFINNIIDFQFSNANDVRISGDYTAGIDDAIPNNVPVYNSVQMGDWDDPLTWGLTSGTVIPNGAIFNINHDVTVNKDDISAYVTQIKESGRVIVPKGKINISLGITEGTGNIRLFEGNIPAGNYIDFFNYNGGTLEYSGTDNYNIDITKINNLKFIGSGTYTLPNNNIIVLGDLTINSGTVNSSFYNKDIIVEGNIIYNGGNVNVGTSNIILSGNAKQEIAGTNNFVGSNSLYNLKIDNINGVELNSDVVIKNNLNLKEGIIYTKETEGLLTINNTAENAIIGGDYNSYVQGYLAKNISLNGKFKFPIGDKDRYGKMIIENASAGIWIAKFNNNNPTDDGYNIGNADPSVARVNDNEYWQIKGADGSKCKVRLFWDDYSSIVPNKPFSFAKWEGHTGQWEKVKCRKGNNNAVTIDYQNINGNTDFIFTFATDAIPKYTWLGITSDWFAQENWVDGDIPDVNSTITIGKLGGNRKYPIIESNNIVEIGKISIASGGPSLTIKPGTRVTFNQEVETGNNLIIENSNEKPTSIFIEDNVEFKGNVQYKWNYAPNRYWYVGHAITKSKMSSYNNKDGYSDYYLARYYSNNWQKVEDVKLVFNNPLEGCSVAFNQWANVTHIGKINTASSYKRQVPSENWLLMANPYSSYLSVDNKSAWNFGDLDKTIWVRTTLSNDNRGYITYNFSGAGVIIANQGNAGDDVSGTTVTSDRLIAPGQSFWVVNKTNHSTEFKLDKTACVIGDTNVQLKSKKTNKQHDSMICVKLNNDFYSDELVLLFDKNGSFNYIEKDSQKRLVKNSSIPNIYLPKGNKKVVIGYLPEINNEIIVPVALDLSKKAAGYNKISFTNISKFLDKYNLVLVDKEKNVQIDIRENSFYEYMAKPGVNKDRFEIRIKRLATAVNNIKNNNKNVSVYYKNNVITIKENLLDIINGKNKKVNIIVTNTVGKTIISEKYNYSGTHIINAYLNKGIYIVTVGNDDYSYSSKIVVD